MTPSTYLLPAGQDAVSTPTGHWGSALHDARRGLILSAARDEFIDKGLEGASMRSIALRAGCTTGAIYPHFESKERMYAALLAQSLERLDTVVLAAVQAASTAPDSAPGVAHAQVRAGCQAFLAYYMAHPFEVNLGLYAFRGLKRQGVGKPTDRELNAALWQVLDRIAQPLEQSHGGSAEAAQSLVALLFSQMIGALVLQLAGRLDPLGTDPARLLDLMLATLAAATAHPEFPPTKRRQPDGQN